MSGPPVDECDALLSRGGWEADDAEAYLRESPGTFWLPPKEELLALRPGASIKAIFSVVDLADFSRDGIAPYDKRGRPNLTRGHERMWCWVEQVNPATLEVVLQNQPYATYTRLCAGARLTLRIADVIEVVLSPPVRMEDAFKLMTAKGAPLLAPEVVLRPLSRDDAPRIARGSGRPLRPAMTRATRS